MEELAVFMLKWMQSDRWIKYCITEPYQRVMQEISLTGDNYG
jgi:hypothetical protein